MADAGGAMLNGVSNEPPLANSAIARRSAAVRPCVIDTIDPNSSVSRIRCGGMARNRSRAGARSAPPA
jgi:hypothetical protein